VTDRRPFIASILVLLALAPASAQKTPPVVAYIGSGRERSTTVFLDSFKQGMRDAGLLEGRDYLLETRWADGDYDRFPALVAELVRASPAVIVVATIASARAAQHATRLIPIVMTGLNDPVGMGLVLSLARPGGNITGLSSNAEDVTDKIVELLRAAVPQAKSVAVLLNTANPSNRAFASRAREIASSLGLTIRLVEMTNVSDLDGLFTALLKHSPDALIISPDSALHDQRELISALALRHRLPTIAQLPEYAEAGALMGYGQSRREAYERTARYVHRILHGAKPQDLPVEQPTRLILAVNLKTARALGLTIPQSLLLRAERVVE
jgi:putative ABC transport system substrate-binding protein